MKSCFKKPNIEGNSTSNKRGGSEAKDMNIVSAQSRKVKEEKAVKHTVPTKACFDKFNSDGPTTNSYSRKRDNTTINNSLDGGDGSRASTGVLFTIDQQGENASQLDSSVRAVKRVKKERIDNNFATESKMKGRANDSQLNDTANNHRSQSNSVIDLTKSPDRKPMRNTTPTQLKSEGMDIAADASSRDQDTHVIFAIDNSGSMRERDVKSDTGNITRSDAVWKCVDSFLNKQIQQQESNSDNGKCLVSVLIFSTEADVLVERMVLEGDGQEVRAVLQKQQRRKQPRSHGYFNAAFKQASILAKGNPTSGSERIVLIFLTDGRPSDLDSKPPRIGDEMQTMVKRRGKKIRSLAHYINKMQDTHQQFNLQLICLHDEGKPVSKHHCLHVCVLNISSPHLNVAFSSSSGWNIYHTDLMEPCTTQISPWTKS
jgi:Mg-chelatase subunit ChlD